MEFWTIIESRRQAPLDIESAAAALESALKAMPESDILAFCIEFDRKMDEAYAWPLWGVATLINGGCSDDTFMDFRGGLIASGKEVFDKAIADPESLMDLDGTHLAAMFEEGFVYCGPAAYEAVSGRPPEPRTVGIGSPTGTEWQETRESLQQQFPRAWSVYGWEEAAPDASAPAKKPWWRFW